MATLRMGLRRTGLVLVWMAAACVTVPTPVRRRLAAHLPPLEVQVRVSVDALGRVSDLRGAPSMMPR